MGKNKFPDSDDRFNHAPYFNFNDDKLKFDTKFVDNANDNYGSVSGFSPKSLFSIEKRAPSGAPHLYFFEIVSNHQAFCRSHQ